MRLTVQCAESSEAPNQGYDGGTMDTRTYKPGVYKLTERCGDADSPVVYFDGKSWWLPGWECQMELGSVDGSFQIEENSVGEMIWEDKERSA